MVPLVPTAKQVVVDGQLTPRKLVVPENWEFQRMPPLLVCKMAPSSPTAKQTLAVGQLTLLRSFVGPEDWAIQVVPPSLVCKMEPAWPTAKQVVVDGQLTPPWNCLYRRTESASSNRGDPEWPRGR